MPCATLLAQVRLSGTSSGLASSARLPDMARSATALGTTDPGPLLCRFSDARMRTNPRALTAGVGKAPRREIAELGSPTVQRLSGISVEAHGSHGRFSGEQLAEPADGRIGAGVWRAGKGVQRLGLLQSSLSVPMTRVDRIARHRTSSRQSQTGS